MTDAFPPSPSSLSSLAQQSLEDRMFLKQTIAEQRAFVEVADLREAVFTHLHTASAPFALPVEAYRANRRTHLKPVAALLRAMLDPESPHPSIRSLARNLHLAGQLGWSPREFCPRPSAYDARFHDPDDLLVPFFTLIFQDQHAGLLRRWMQALDGCVCASSRANVLAMDQAARRQSRPVRKDVVLVGGSALTCLVASILGAYFHVTVISPHGLGRPWRDRPLFLNSSVSVNDFNGPALPLLDGPTTRILGSQPSSSLQVDALLGGDALRVYCEDGSQVEYVSGLRLGDLIATNLFWHADDYLLGHTLDVSALGRTADGHLRLSLVAEDGTRRELDANALFLLTGPGPERTAIAHAPTQALYEQMRHQVVERIQQAKQRMGWSKLALEKLEPDPRRCGSQIHWVRARRNAQTIPLPRILTLSSIEALYRHWITDGQREPALYPFTELMCRPQTVAYVGAGDTMRTVKELLEKRGPREAYPPDLGPVKVTGTIYKEGATSPDVYDVRNRRRYQGLFTPQTTAVPFKVTAYRLVTDEEGEATGVEVTYRNAFSGAICTLRHDYLIDATGLNRSPIESLLPAEFAIRTLRDLEGKVVARGDTEAGLFICGSATQFRAIDLPEELQRIIRLLAIPENTVSLWVHAALAERHALSFVATHQATKWETTRKDQS